MSRTILIVGATGNQGSAVLSSLLDINNNTKFTLLALTRDASSPAAKRASARSTSVQMLQGDMNKPDEIFSEARRLTGQPVWGVFMVQVLLSP